MVGGVHIFTISPPLQSEDASFFLLERQFCHTPEWRRGYFVILLLGIALGQPPKTTMHFLRFISGREQGDIVRKANATQYNVTCRMVSHQT